MEEKMNKIDMERDEKKRQMHEKSGNTRVERRK